MSQNQTARPDRLAPVFTFPVQPEDLFAERARQWRGWGIPASTSDSVRRSVKEMWLDGPGGWEHEWSRRAESAERAGRLLEAAACYGAARFPCAATPSRKQAQRRQLECYLKAAERFPCRFERRKLMVSYCSKETPVMVHLFEPRRGSERARRALLCVSGGVDTFKIELHRLCVGLARFGRLTVAAIDMPGTGESAVSLAPDADVIYKGVIGRLAAGRGPGTKTAVMGMSFGGHWAAKMALLEQVDCAVDIGGPVDAEPRSGRALVRLPHGMTGIVANAVGFERLPSEEESEQILAGFSLRKQGLLDRTRTAPILVVNGADDQYLPAADTLVFSRFSDASVWMIKGAPHCAADRFPRLVPAVIGWLRCQLFGDSYRDRLLAALGRAILPSTI